MITEEEFAQQERALGVSMHHHDGVWWRSLLRVFSKPVFEHRLIEPGQAKPSRRHAPLGYVHRIADDTEANAFTSEMALDGKTLREFSIKTLPSSKRARVRKGFGALSIGTVDDVAPHLSDLEAINVSQAIRTEHGLPPDYYAGNRESWRRHMLKLAAQPGREFVGATLDGRLVAYIFQYEVEGVLVIAAAKSHTEYLSQCPNDALLFYVLKSAAASSTCRKVVHGGGAETEGLARFKRQFGFRPTRAPMYASHPWIYNTAKRLPSEAGRLSDAFYRWTLHRTIKRRRTDQ